MIRIALAQVKASSIYENLLNEIQHIVYSLYCENEKKVYNNIMYPIQI